MIGNKIKQARIERGLTQEELADRSYIDRSSISRVENDKHDITIGTLEHIVKALDGELHIEILNVPKGKIKTQEYTIKVLQVEACDKHPVEMPKSLDILEMLNQITAPRIPPSHKTCVWLWERILEAGVLEKKPNAIKITIESEEETALLDCVDSLMFLNEEIYADDNPLGVPKLCGIRRIVDSINVTPETNEIVINLADAKNYTEIVKKGIKREKNKIKESEKYFEEHNHTFAYLVYESSASLPNNILDLDAPFDFVNASSPAEALQKYLEVDKDDRMLSYFDYYFVEDFCRRSFWDECEDFCDEEMHKLLLNRIQSLKANKNNTEKIGPRLVNVPSRDEIYRIVGKTKFEQMWLEFERGRHEIIQSKRQKEMSEYLN